MRIERDGATYRKALREWLRDCRRRIALRFPTIAFSSAEWRFRSLDGCNMKDLLLTPALADFSGRDESFILGMRCIAAELALGERVKALTDYVNSFRLLRNATARALFELSYRDIRKIESREVNYARANPSSAHLVLANLTRLGRYINLLAAKGVIPPIRYTMTRELRTELAQLERTVRRRWKEQKASILDHQIEALSLALNALFANDPRLSAHDRVAVAMMGLEMCAPSRVNELLCSSIDDHVTLDDYVGKTDGQQLDRLHATHQLLIVTMKGSKGAQWSAKPVLNFMIDLFNHCHNVIIKHGERSRMLAAWYEQHPDMLYLPPELEYLRGRDISRSDLAKIMRLSEIVPEERYPIDVRPIVRALRDSRIKALNPNSAARGKSKHILVIPWRDIEATLLGLVRKAMVDCRRVTKANFYTGALSKMLFLFDREDTPYLPSSAKYRATCVRLKQTDTFRNHYRDREGAFPEPTLFAKLGITIPVNGRVQVAFIDTHDPRRWLTTQAMLHGERLPDVLINKWANRLSIEHLQSYDLRTPEQKADLAMMPDVVELKDISAGMRAMHKLEEGYGLKTEIVTVHDAGISVTSMDAIVTAVDDRPVASTSEQLFIIYPSLFGACIHQHHETPCRSYSSCLPCDNNLVVKGHIPTNDKIRERQNLLYKSIVEQLEKLLIAQDREIPDHPEALAAHLLTLVREGLDPEQMANELIDKFHEIRHLIKDICFAVKLEEAFVAKGLVTRLDDPNVPSGALIKYHNPTRHAAPGLERALDAHGGHAEIEQRRKDMIRQYPQFAPTYQGLNDQRSLVAPEDDRDE